MELHTHSGVWLNNSVTPNSQTGLITPIILCLQRQTLNSFTCTFTAMFFFCLIINWHQFSVSHMPLTHLFTHTSSLVIFKWCLCVKVCKLIDLLKYQKAENHVFSFPKLSRPPHYQPYPMTFLTLKILDSLSNFSVLMELWWCFFNNCCD